MKSKDTRHAEDGLHLSRRELVKLGGAVFVATGVGARSASVYAAGTPGDPQGSMVIAMPDEPPDLGLDRVAGTYGHPLRNIGEALVQRDRETMELIPSLAVSWEQVDELTWRFTLREGVKFHDGTPFNAEAAAFALNYMWNPDNALNNLSRAGPKFNVTAIDDKTIELVLESPDPILPGRMHYTPIPSMDQLKNRPEEYKTTPIGTGPYKFVSFDAGQSLKMTANPDWWGINNPEAAGEVTIKDVEFVMRPQDIVRLSMVQTGEAQLGRWVTSSQCQEAPQCESVTGLTMILLRTDVPHVAMQDIRVRQAIGHALDREAFVEKILGGGTVRNQLVGPATFGFNPDLEPFVYDPEKAKALIAEAKADGVPVDAPLRIVSRIGPVPNVNEGVEAVAFALNEIGLNAKPEMMEFAAFDNVAYEKPVPPDRGVIQLWVHTQNLFDYGGTVDQYYTSDGNNTAVHDPVLDEMYAKAEPLVGEPRRKALQEIAQYIREKVYYIPIGQAYQNYAMADNLEWQPRMDALLQLKEMKLK